MCGRASYIDWCAATNTCSMSADIYLLHGCHFSLSELQEAMDSCADAACNDDGATYNKIQSGT